MNTEPFDSTEILDGYACPVDPMDLVQCESCQ